MLWLTDIDKENNQMINSCNSSCYVFLKWNMWNGNHNFFEKDYLVKVNYIAVAESYSKWLNVQAVPSTDNNLTIRVSRKMSGKFELPVEMVHEIEKSFTAHEFR